MEGIDKKDPTQAKFLEVTQCRPKFSNDPYYTPERDFGQLADIYAQMANIILRRQYVMIKPFLPDWNVESPEFHAAMESGQTALRKFFESACGYDMIEGEYIYTNAKHLPTFHDAIKELYASLGSNAIPYLTLFAMKALDYMFFAGRQTTLLGAEGRWGLADVFKVATVYADAIRAEQPLVDIVRSELRHAVRLAVAGGFTPVQITRLADSLLFEEIKND